MNKDIFVILISFIINLGFVFYLGRYFYNKYMIVICPRKDFEKYIKENYESFK